MKLQYFGHLMQRANSLEKNPDVGKDCWQEEKGPREDEIAGWHHQLNGHEFGGNFNFIRITSLIFNCLKGREKKSSPKKAAHRLDFHRSFRD